MKFKIINFLFVYLLNDYFDQKMIVKMIKIVEIIISFFVIGDLI